MREELVTLKVFKFDELKSDVQEKVLSRFRRDVDLDFSNDYLQERFKEMATEKGFDNSSFNWCLGYCQGDGVSFTANVDLEKFLSINGLKDRFKSLLDVDAVFKVVRGNSHYYHKYTVDAEYDLNADFDSEEMKRLSEELKTLIDAEKNRICDACEKIGYGEYEFIISDECLKYNIQSNEYEFLENGKNYPCFG